MITHVAIRAADGKVYALPAPARHADLYERFPELRTERTGGLLVTREGQTQGFLANWYDDGRLAIRAKRSSRAAAHFVDRKQALTHVTRCKQRLTNKPGGVHAGQLYSEGVW